MHQIDFYTVSLNLMTVGHRPPYLASLIPVLIVSVVAAKSVNRATRIVCNPVLNVSKQLQAKVLFT
jgi:hypothetical protein